MHYAAGILPVTWHQGQALFLVGKDARDGTWSDFGGKCERCDKNDPLTTAAREFFEETYNLLVDGSVLRRRLHAGNTVLLRSRTQNAHPYYMYVAEVPYLPYLPRVVQRTLAFLRYRNLYKTCVEKTEVRWVTWEAMRSGDLPKRGVFRATVEAHASSLARIAAGKDSWEDLCASCAATSPDPEEAWKA